MNRIGCRFVSTCFFLVCVLSELANAAPLRLKLRPSTGELIKVDRPCGKAAQRELWSRVFRAFYIEVFERSEVPKGRMIAAFGERAAPADRVIAAEPFEGIFDLADGRTSFTINVRDRMRGRHWVPVEVRIVIRGQDPADVCTESWLGLAERL